MAKKKIIIEWENNHIDCSYDVCNGTSTIEILGVLEFVKMDIFSNKNLRSQEEE